MTSAIGGGLILSWISEDTGSAVQHHLPSATLVPEWGSTPLYGGEFPDYHFYVQHNPQPQDLPSNLASLGANDAAMISAFETNLGAMNAEVAANAAASAAAPVPPSPTPGSKTWYRLIANWGYSGDGDYRPDWMEWADGTSDPFNGDSNGDGNPDTGDFDNDGILDHLDAVPNEDLIDWEKVGKLHYIFLPIEVPDTAGPPKDINDEGEVLFSNGVWEFDTYTELPPESPIYTLKRLVDGEVVEGDGVFESVGAVGIDKDGKVAGNGLWGYTKGALVWPSKTSSPLAVGRDAGLWLGNLAPYEVMSMAPNGHFLVTGAVTQDPLGNDPKPRSLSVFKTEDDGAVEVGRAEAPFVDYQIVKGAITSGVNGEGWVSALNVFDSNGDVHAKLWDNGDMESLDGPEGNFTGLSYLPNGRLGVASEAGVWLQDDSGAWDDTPYLGQAFKMNRQGVAITQNGYVWADGEYHHFENLCPAFGDEGYNSPEFVTINNSGVILIQAKKDGDNEKKFPALGVPIGFYVPDGRGVEVHFKKAEELKVAKFKGGVLANTEFQYTADVDRFRIRMGSVKIAANTLVKATIETKHLEELADYNDNLTKVDMTFDQDEKAFETQDQVLVSCDIDDDHEQEEPKIEKDDTDNDCTHKVALGGTVYVDFVRIGNQTYSAKLSAPVKAHKKVTVRFINPKKGASFVAKAADVERHVKEVKERFAQVGLLVEEVILNPDASNDADFSNVELPFGEDAANPANMTQHEKDLLNEFTTADAGDVEILYVDNFHANAKSHGIAYSSDRVAAGLPARYNNTMMVEENPAGHVVAHELGHVLIRDWSHPEISSNLMSEDAVFQGVGNQRPFETRRLSSSQEEEIHKHPNVEDVEEE